MALVDEIRELIMKDLDKARDQIAMAQARLKNRMELHYCLSGLSGHIENLQISIHNGDFDYDIMEGQKG